MFYVDGYKLGSTPWYIDCKLLIFPDLVVVVVRLVVSCYLEEMLCCVRKNSADIRPIYRNDCKVRLS